MHNFLFAMLVHRTKVRFTALPIREIASDTQTHERVKVIFMDEADHNSEKSATTEKAGAGSEMHVRVHAPYKVYFDGPAQSVSAINDTGPFDVLAKHHNFMTLLSACDLIVRHGDEQEKISIQRGVMHVKANEVVVFLDV